MIAETTIRTALVAAITSVDATAKVHRRFRYAKDAQVSAFVNLFRETASPHKVNGYMIRRVRRIPEMTGVPGRLKKVTHVYKIRFYAHLIDSNDPAIASEEIAQSRIEALAAALEANVNLGLGASISHEGLGMEMDFTDVILGDTAVHRNDLGISVTAMNVNCP